MLLDAFDSNWIAPLGPHVDAFECEFAERVALPHAAALSSGTAALQLALRILGVGPGDDVLTASFTFAATANAVTYCGATPVLVDSDPATWCISADLLEEELRQRAARNRLPAAVIAVDLYGHVPDYESLRKSCDAYAIPLIEDAAESLGSEYRGRPAGSFGDLNAFSFNGNKIITTSGGGMLAGLDPDQIAKARFLATQAREPAPHYEHNEIGYNYRLSNLLAAIGRAQLRSLDRKVAARRAVRANYITGLSELGGICVRQDLPLERSNAWLTCIEIDPDEFGANQEQVRLALADANIESRPLWKPMHLQPVFAHAPRVGGSVCEGLFARGLCLPSGSSLSRADQARVIEIIHRCRE